MVEVAVPVVAGAGVTLVVQLERVAHAINPVRARRAFDWFFMVGMV